MARTRAAVLAAGEQLLTERGVRGVTVEDIANRTGIAKTTIYRHWPSKAELVMAVVARQAFEFPEVDSGDVAQDLTACLRALSDALADPTRRVTLLGMLEIAARDPAADTVHRAFLDVRGSPLRAVIERGIASGRVSPDQRVSEIIPLLVGPIVVRALFFGERLDDDEIDRLCDRVLVGPPSR